MFLKLPFAVSFSVLFFTIQCAVFRKSFIYIYINDLRNTAHWIVKNKRQLAAEI